jgi:hypothetical protein
LSGKQKRVRIQKVVGFKSVTYLLAIPDTAGEFGDG